MENKPTIEQLFKLHLEATKKRGKIDYQTTNRDFAIKAEEELFELWDELVYASRPNQQEAIDLMCVCANWLQMRGYDIRDELEKNVKHQQTRTD